MKKSEKRKKKGKKSECFESEFLKKTWQNTIVNFGSVLIKNALFS